MTIDLKVTPRRDALLLGHNNTLDVLVRAVGPAAPEGAPARRRLNLAIVIDRSGSMRRATPPGGETLRQGDCRPANRR